MPGVVEKGTSEDALLGSDGDTRTSKAFHILGNAFEMCLKRPVTMAMGISDTFQKHFTLR